MPAECSAGARAAIRALSIPLRGESRSLDLRTTLPTSSNFARNLFLTHQQVQSEAAAEGLDDSAGDGAVVSGDGVAAAAAGMLAGAVGGGGAGSGKAKQPWMSAMLQPSNMKVGGAEGETGRGRGGGEGGGREREKARESFACLAQLAKLVTQG